MLKTLPYYILLIFFISCTKSPSQKSLVIGKELTAFIKNTGSQTVVIKLNINNRLYNSGRGLVSAIMQMPEEYPLEPLERKAWRFVINHTINLTPITSERWIHDPLIMLNSVGFSHCDDLATVLHLTWKQLGFKTRLWDLNGHVVPEVFAGNRWQMYDPSLGVYYFNREGGVAGEEELEDDPDLIRCPVEKLVANRHRFFMHHAKWYSDDVAQLYQSGEDNEINEWYAQTEGINNFSVELPAGAKLEFPVPTQDSIYVLQIFGRWRLPTFIKLTLPLNWQGKIHLPFAVCQIKGEGDIILNGNHYRIEDDTLNRLLKQFRQYYPDIELTGTIGSTEIYCMINPGVFHYSDNDTLIVKGDDLTNVELRTGDKRSPLCAMNTLKNWLNVTRLASVYYSYYRDNLENLTFISQMVNQPDMNKYDLLRGFQLLLPAIDSLSEYERDLKAKALIEKWQSINDSFLEINNGKAPHLINNPAYFIMYMALLEYYSKEQIIKMMEYAIRGMTQ